MSEINKILGQFELNATFFIQFLLFAGLFFVLNPVYFQPFLRLFQARHKRTVEDRESAEQMIAQAEEKLREHRSRISEERAAARRELEAVLQDVKLQEAQLLAQARSQAKAIQTQTFEEIEKESKALKKKLEAELDETARGVAETLLERRG